MDERDAQTGDWGLVPVEITYRAGNEPGKPPDVGVIQKAMAIVAWQPGPNRIVQVPNEVSGPDDHQTHQWPMNRWMIHIHDGSACRMSYCC